MRYSEYAFFSQLSRCKYLIMPSMDFILSVYITGLCKLMLFFFNMKFSCKPLKMYNVMSIDTRATFNIERYQSTGGSRYKIMGLKKMSNADGNYNRT